MLPNIGSGELILIAIIALIVIRPKELPAVLRTVGRTFGALKRMANQFRGEFNKALQESELENIRQDLTRETQSIRQAIPSVDDITAPKPEAAPAMPLAGTAVADGSTDADAGATIDQNSKNNHEV